MVRERDTKRRGFVICHLRNSLIDRSGFRRVGPPDRAGIDVGRGERNQWGLSRRLATGERKPGRREAVGGPRSMGSRKVRRRPRRPRTGPAEWRWLQIAQVEPSRRIVRPRRRNDESAHEKAGGVERLVAVAEDTETAVASATRMCGKLAASIEPGVAILLRHSAPRADVAVRESAVSRRGDDEAQGLRQNEAHERDRREPVRQSLRIQPKRDHCAIECPDESDVNASDIKYSNCCSRATCAMKAESIFSRFDRCPAQRSERRAHRLDGLQPASIAADRVPVRPAASHLRRRARPRDPHLSADASPRDGLSPARPDRRASRHVCDIVEIDAAADDIVFEPLLLDMSTAKTYPAGGACSSRKPSSSRTGYVGSRHGFA